MRLAHKFFLVVFLYLSIYLPNQNIILGYCNHVMNPVASQFSSPSYENNDLMSSSYFGKRNFRCAHYLLFLILCVFILLIH